jgi:transposase
MGFSGRIEDKLRAQKLRHQGLSYKEILQTIFVSKSTISMWCKNIQLTEGQKLRLLNKKQFGQRKGSLVAAENKRNARIERTKKIRDLAKKDIGRIINRDKFMVGIALYAAEGNKNDGKAGFSNADPKLIKFMTDWFMSFAKVPIKKLRGAIWLHEGLSEKKSKKFWSSLINLPLNQFHKTYIAKVKSNSKKVRKNIHQYGVFQIRFSDSAIHRKIMGWIYAVFNDKIA